MKTVKMAVVLVAACVAMASGCNAKGAGGKSTATCVLRISYPEPMIQGESGPRSSGKDAFEVYKKTQRQLVTSRLVLSAALGKPEVAKLPSVEAEQQKGDPVRWLERTVEVEFPGDADIMTVSVSLDDSQEATALADAVVDAYLREVVNAERDQKQQRLSELDHVYAEKEAEARAKREELRKLSEQRVEEINDSADTEMLRNDIKDLGSVLSQLDTERDRLKVEIRATPRVTQERGRLRVEVRGTPRVTIL